MPRINLPGLADCAACELARYPVVYPEGGAGADILVVGEAPGAEEAKAQLPFVGPTGKMLRQFEARAKIHHRCVHTNVLKHRPPGNRDPEPNEVAACAQWLSLEVSIVKPKAVICVGRFAAKWGGFKGGIGKNHGKVVERGGVLWAAIYHPSYLARLRRQPRMRDRYREVEASTLACLTEVRERLDTTATMPDYQPRVVDCAIPTEGEYTLDTEYTGEDERTHRITMLSLRQGRVNYVFPHPGRERLAEFRGRPNFHHAMADLPALIRDGMPVPDAVDDSMVLAWMQGERHLALKDLMRTHFGIITMPYEEVVDKGGWDAWMNYAAQDVEGGESLLAFERSRMGSERFLYYNVETKLLPILAVASLHGFQVDPA